MALADRRKMSLYDEAKAGLSSLVKQTAQVFMGLLVMLLLTGGNPPGWVVALSFFGGIGFVAWSENKRLTETVPQQDGDLTNAEEFWQQGIIVSAGSIQSRQLQIRQQDLDLTNAEALIPQDISRNKRVVLERSCVLFSLDSQNLENLIQQVVKAKTDNFLELAKIACLNPAEDFAGVDLSNAYLSFANLSGAKLSGADLSYANLSYAKLSHANLSRANLSYANLSYANLNAADLSRANLRFANLNAIDLIAANLSGANLSHANLRFADLSSANLGDAIVEKARFGGNLGLSEEMKFKLKRRGAIFEDSPGDRSNISTPV